MKNLILIIILFSCFPTFSQSYFGYQITLTHENDFLGTYNNDENYTGGFNLEIVFPKSRIMQPFFELNNGKNFNSFSLGGTGYTPQDLASVDVVLVIDHMLHWYI